MTTAVYTYDFGLTAAQEERARKVFQESIVIDLLFQGPAGRAIFTEEMSEELKRSYKAHGNAQRLWAEAWLLPVRRALQGKLPAFRETWEATGVTAGNRQVGIGDSLVSAYEGLALAQAQFDKFSPWLVKALTADDIRRAKAEGKVAGYMSTQNSIHVGTNLDNLNHFYDLGMRMIQLTYNSVNWVGGGCTDRADCGVTDYGVKFIKRMNDLGILVDLGHCGRQTTLDACALSEVPVVASHTAAEGVRFHARAKSDEELRAIAGTGGVIGVYAVPSFLTDDPKTGTIELLLDQIDYIANLVGYEHVGLGTDWPMQGPDWAVEVLGEWAKEIGFRPEHTFPGPETLKGFDTYLDFINIARGLVKRGYSDEQISAILGGNALRVFEQVWK